MTMYLVVNLQNNAKAIYMKSFRNSFDLNGDPNKWRYTIYLVCGCDNLTIGIY